MKYFTVGNSRETLPAKIARRSKWFADLKISDYDLFAIAVNQGFIITKPEVFKIYLLQWIFRADTKIKLLKQSSSRLSMSRSRPVIYVHTPPILPRVLRFLYITLSKESS